MNQDPFKVLKESIKEGKDRWNKIEVLAEKLKSPVLERDVGERSVAELLVLLVEHLRPLYSLQNGTDVDALLKKMQNALKVGKK